MPMSLNPRLVPWLFGLVALAALDVGWHGRSRPPALPVFRAPPVTTEPAEEPQLIADEPVTRVPATPPAPPPVEAPAPKVEAAPPPPPPVKAAEPPKAGAPTIVGSWRMTEMTMNGQSAPGIDQVSMSFTFKADGTVAAVHEMASAGMHREQEGTYEISGDQITIRMDQHPQTMTFSFEGNDRLILSFQQMRMVLTRA
jgi:hypothetical protein